MKTVHILRVDGPPEAFTPLIAAARAAGLRAGWLDLETLPEPPEPVARAADSGVLRAVARTASGTVTVKRVGGSLVLEDLLREQFSGCRWVLVRGEVAAPRLTPTAEAWRIESDEGSWDLSTDDLVARLKRPRATFLSG